MPGTSPPAGLGRMSKARKLAPKMGCWKEVEVMCSRGTESDCRGAVGGAEVATKISWWVG